MRLKSLLMVIAALIATIPAMKGSTPLSYHNTCDDISTVTVLNESSSSSAKWHTYKYSSNSVYRCKQSSSDLSRNIHATVWTPALEIETGKLYRASVVVGVQSTNANAKAQIAMYATAGSTADKTILLEIAPLTAFTTSTRPNAVEQIFVGDASKPYLGIKNSGGGPISYFVVDDIIVEEYEGEIPPKQIDNLTATSTGRSVSIEFTLPTQNVLNENLDNITKTTLLRDNNVINEWSDQAPGTTLTYTDIISTAGQYQYTIICTTNNTESRSHITTDIDGYPTPSQCTTYERDENGNIFGHNYYAPATYIPGEGIKITWKPSTDANATYSVIRIGDNKEIVAHTTTTEALDTDYILDIPATYQYLIKQDNGETNVDLYTSSLVSLNNTLPFIPSINLDALNEFTITDNDKDTYSWSVLTNGSIEKHGVTKYFSTARRGDDWLITPGFQLEAGKTYRIDLDALCSDLIESNVGVQVMAGKANTTESMTDEIIPAVIFKHMFPETYTGFYTPEESGNIFFGIRSLDPTGNNSFDDMGVSNITIAEVDGNTPVAINDLHLIHSSTPSIASLIFTAPTQNVMGTTITSLKSIVIYQNNEKIHSIENPIPGKEYNIEVSFEMSTEVSFKVVPISSVGSGLSANLTTMIRSTPYSTSFVTEDELTGYSIINPDMTGNTWSYLPISEAMRSFAFSNDTHDEYLITPGMFLEKGYFYKIDFITWLEGVNGNYMEDNAIEVLLGTAPTVDALTTTIVQPYVIQGTLNNEVLLKDWFTVPETGIYYIAWHAMSKPGLAEELFIDNINISARIPDSYPAAVDNFAILPDPEGALQATISFDLPTTDMAGNTMTNNFYEYKIYCDGIEVNNGPGVPGKHIDFLHTTTQGVHLYTVRCFGAANEPTRDIENVAYIGINRPGHVEFVEVTENADQYGKVIITWGLPTSDINGFELNTSNISYIVGEYFYDPNSGEQKEIVYATDVRDLSYTKVVKSETDEQEFMRFFVRAKTTAGEGNPTVITKFAAIGKPFDLPFTESFVNGIPQHIMMQERPFEGKMAQWGYNQYNPITGVEPVDGDNGLALMEVMEPDNGARLFTLRINLNAERPIMTFYVYNQSNDLRIDNNMLGISIREGNNDFKLVANKSINDWAKGNRGWHKASIDLSDYAGKVVYIGFEGMAKNLTFTHLDNIVIATPADIDMAISSISHPQIYVGVEHEIEVTVLNNGGKSVNNTAIDLYLDDTFIETRIIDELAAGQEQSFTFSNMLTREDLGQHTYRAEIAIDNDADLLNNSISAPSFYLQDNSFPTVENLQAQRVDDEIKLSWDEPLIPDAATVITDDFESYPSWSTMTTGGLGDYTLIDGDGCGVGGFQNIELPNIPYGSKQSFTLWDFSNEIFAYDQTISDRYKAHSGDKCLVSIFCPGEDSWCEDRIISPRLSGESQTISFYAKSLDDENVESFQVYYSFDGKTLSDYFDNRFSRQSVGGTWTQFTYDLPEGTQYFVIERFSNGFFLFLDDFTYTPVGDETLQNNGYNVYRDNVKLNDTPIAGLNYSDIDTQDIDINYGVSVVYDRGESPIKEILVEHSGIDDVVVNVNVTVQNREIVISGAKNLDIAIITTSGMILTSRRASAVERIPVQPGIYMVNVAGTVYKVAVK